VEVEAGVSPLEPAEPELPADAGALEGPALADAVAPGTAASCAWKVEHGSSPEDRGGDDVRCASHGSFLMPIVETGDVSDLVRKPKLRPLSALRVALVVFAGPVACVGAVVWAAIDTVRSLVRDGHPRRLALLTLVAGAAYAAGVRWMRRWGATPQERHMALAGDETVPNPSVQHTRAVTIAAPTARVWPWLAQIGQDRAGFYSYTWLENLAGCRMRNADRVHPEWQQRQIGDQLLLHPQTGLQVLGLSPGHSLTLDGGWYFVLEPDGPDRSRLLARWRSPSGPLNLVFGLLFDLPHFVMERKLLLGIKQRAEAVPAEHAPHPE
jgi:hypothetical protein